MRAIGLTEFGGPEVLRVIELPDPVPGPGEVRIRVHAASVSPTDALLRAGAAPAWFEGRPGPYVPGMDAAGVVDAIGPDTDTALRPGDPVIAIVRAYGPRGGAYAELVVVPAQSVVPIPSGADFPAAATLPMNALTARLALDLLAVPAGGTVAVTGAAGAFGGYAVQLARSDGLRVLADAVGRRHATGGRPGRRRGRAARRRCRHPVPRVAPDGVDAVLDGAALNELIVPAIRDGGGLAVIRGWTGPAERGIRLHPVRVTEAATDHARLLRLRDQASTGALTLRVADVLPAGQAAQAHRRLAEGGLRGRLVLDFTGFQ